MLGVAATLVVRGGGHPLSDLGTGDLPYLSVGEIAPPRLAGAESGRSASDVLARGRGGRGLVGGDGLGVGDRRERRPQRRSGDHVA